MKPLIGYLILAFGIFTGIASNSFAKISDGFTKLTPSILCILLMCITMFSIAKAMSVIPVGFAYSTYSGLTVTGVLVFALLKYNQIFRYFAIFCHFINLCFMNKMFSISYINTAKYY